MKTIISMTLLHSLWQGGILAAITELILVGTRNAPAKIRYRYLTAALALFTLSMAATLVAMLSKTLQADHTILVTTEVSDTTGLAVPGLGIVDPERLVRYATSHAASIFWAWLLIMVAKGFWMGYGMVAVQRLKHVRVYDAGQYWTEKVRIIGAQLGIHRKVQILHSGLANVPVVIGHVKPVILMPLGLINRLTVAEVEAIISHELAHILRKDYLVNLLQVFLETVFFFNPAVLWLNSLIRQEREHCCDDLALQVHAGTRDYINALLGCYEFQPHANRFALAFPGPKNQLLNRVTRIAGAQKARVIRPAKAAMILVLLTTGIAVAALSAQQESRRRTITRRINLENHLEATEISDVLTRHLTAADISRQQADAAEADALAAEADSAVAVTDRQVAVQSKLQERFTEMDGAAMHRALYEDGIIPDLENASYMLNNDALIVNGIKQSEATRQKYAARYLKSPGKRISYDYHLKKGPAR
ncbi:MAG: M56 family metallopeptidase [Sphingobacteriales bacterium]|nr:MAG: M56 family metallopeptidase [Sphingobacteriales bacterium]